MVLGIAVKMTKSDSRTQLVLVSGVPGEESKVVATYVVAGHGPDLAEHVASVARTVRGQVLSLRPDLVVIRRADQPPRSSNSDTPRVRLLIEGGVAAVCADTDARVLLRNGADCARVAGITREQLEEQARSLEKSTPQNLEASAAALSCLL